MAFSKIALTFGVIFCVTLLQCTLAVKQQYHQDELRRRSVGAAPEANKIEQQNQQQAAPAWKPATGPREFTVNVDDNIHGANQHRHEQWNNGTVTGTYAAPGRNGKWLKYSYIGDKNGFRITSTKEVSADDLMGEGNAAAKANEANVNINQDQATPVHYTVTEEQLAKSKEKTAKQNQNQQ